MNWRYYQTLAESSLQNQCLSDEDCAKIISDPELELLALLQASFEVRKNCYGRDVFIHILNNVENGHCSEDCHYCAQSRSSQAPIASYPFKSDEEILAEAKSAYERGAYRYCLVFAGPGPSAARVAHLARLIREIKSRYPLEVCVSPGILDREQIQVLKSAGLDRLNHNLNTSERFYPRICTTHHYSDRMTTLQAAKACGLAVCSGLIVGMGESITDIIEVAKTLRSLRADSIPVNFYLPLEGNALPTPLSLTAEYCLRILCLFRLTNPEADIRVAAGREWYLGACEPLALYPANSLFLDGYLNARGSNRYQTLKMIRDAGFRIKSEFDLQDLLKKEECGLPPAHHLESVLKDLHELRPELSGLNPED